MKDFDDSETQRHAEDNVDIEISDLPPSARSHYLLLKLIALQARLRTKLAGLRRARGVSGNAAAALPLTRRQRRARIGQALTALGLCAALLVLLIGNVPNLRTRLVGLFEPPAPTPTPALVAYGSILTKNQSAAIIVKRPNSHLPNPAQGSPGALPATCPQISPLKTFLTTLDPPGLGSGPLWLSGFDGPTAALLNLQPVKTSLSQPPGAIYGWYETLAVFVQRGFTGSLVLHGESQSKNGEVEFSYPNSLSFAPDLILSLDDPAGLHFIDNGQWEMTTVNVLVPTAGCYALHTAWSSYSWTQYFAAGS